MSRLLSHWLFVLLVACGGTGPSAQVAPSEGGGRPLAADTPPPRILVNRDSHRLALRGHDPVAYFMVGQPELGDPTITAEYQGAVYRFASAAHRDLFVDDPEHYAPQFGGYCGYAASIGRLSPVDPSLFQILDGRLVLQHSPPALALWNQDVAGNLQRADGHWPRLLEENGHPMPLLVDVDGEGLALGGNDPMSYREPGGPQSGSAEHVGNHDGATYHFRARETRYAFEDHPAHNAPQYGGFCALAVSEGRIVHADPRVYELVDERLMMFSHEAARARFAAEHGERVRRADAEWPALVATHGVTR